MTHPIIEKILKLETLEKELLGAQRMMPIIKNRWGVYKPIKTNYIDEARKRNYGKVLAVTEDTDESDGVQVISNQELAQYLLNGGELYASNDVIFIKIPPESEFETDEQYQTRLAKEHRRFEHRLAEYANVESHYNLIHDLEIAITDLTAEIDNELENPEILAIVETYLKSKNTQTPS